MPNKLGFHNMLIKYSLYVVGTHYDCNEFIL